MCFCLKELSPLLINTSARGTSEWNSNETMYMDMDMDMDTDTDKAMETDKNEGC